MIVIRKYEVSIEESVLKAIAEGTVPNTTSIDLYDACTRLIDLGNASRPLYLVQFDGVKDPRSTAIGWDYEYVEGVDEMLYGPITWKGEETDIDLEK